MKPKNLLYFALTLLLYSCATLGGPHPVKTSILAVPPPPETRSPQPEIDLALHEKNYLRALSLLRTVPGEGVLKHPYADAWSQTFNGLLWQAEHNLAQENYPEAGQLFRLAIDNLPEYSAATTADEVDLAMLNERLEYCADLLLEKGLRAYRNGKLQQALDTWNKIGEFHPRHTASQRAISTTRLQLHNLAPLPAS